MPSRKSIQAAIGRYNDTAAEKPHLDVAIAQFSPSKYDHYTRLLPSFLYRQPAGTIAFSARNPTFQRATTKPRSELRGTVLRHWEMAITRKFNRPNSFQWEKPVHVIQKFHKKQKKKIADYGVCELTMPCIPEVFLAYIYTLVYKYDQPTRIMLKSSLREPVWQPYY